MLQFTLLCPLRLFSDSKQISVGKFMAFDRHMNLVLGDYEEFWKLPLEKGYKKPSKDREGRRTLGFVLIRGEEVVSMIIEGPPPPDKSRAKSAFAAAAGPGVGRTAGRGVPTTSLVQAQPGLAGPVRKVGGPASDMIQPQIARPPMVYPSLVMRPHGQPMPGFPPLRMPLRGHPPTEQFAPGSRPPGLPFPSSPLRRYESDNIIV